MVDDPPESPPRPGWMAAGDREVGGPPIEGEPDSVRPERTRAESSGGTYVAHGDGPLNRERSAAGDEYSEDEGEYTGQDGPAADRGPYGLTRGAHFIRLAFHPVTLSYSTIAAMAVFSILTVLVSPIGGAIGAAVAFVVAYAYVFRLAGRRAGENRYGAYADERGLDRHAKGSLPPLTPLLRMGDRRGAEQIMTGVLPGGLSGTLALYTYEVDVAAYEVDVADAENEPEIDYFDLTVALTDLPETAAAVSDLFCERQAGIRSAGGDAGVGTNRQLILSDEAFSEHYEVFFGPRDDEGRLRGLFSPDFVAWLTDEAPPELAFELVAGSLSVHLEGHADTDEELDELSEAAGIIAERLRDHARGR